MTSKGIMIVTLLLALMISATTSSPTSQDVKDVYSHIFNGYDKRVRPVWNQSDVVSVTLSFKLNSINEFDEKSQKLVLSGWFDASWSDESQTWNMSDFGDVPHVYVDGNSIWLPQIALANTFGRVNILSQLASSAAISANGEVEWFPGDSFVVTCEVDITYYPFDTQHCSLVFEIWDAPTSEVILQTSSEPVDVNFFEENGEWTLTKVEVGIPKIDDEVSSITYLLHLQRRPKFVVLTTIAPVLLLAFLNVCVFLIPLSSGEKNSFCVTVYLSYAVFLGTISSELPHNSKNASYLTIYLLTLLVFSVTIFLVTVIQVRLFIEYGDTPVPASVAKMFGYCTLGNRSKVKYSDKKDPDDVKDNRVQALIEDPELKQTNENRFCVKDLLPRLDVPLFCLFLAILCVITFVMGDLAFSRSL
ncbi:neuronal acetylcholine receptor subunit beta-3-like [Mizuhopecten yessoensis]|uniref:Neuronal acetylcholine receptor subunit beta-3 n=1 Tax=Mizuhopecten yessoensis TaxID=6573 RepID=A0A210PXE2_MIZYE|nr:neuronal acetylcholine receptor subunit beta-3-like [Mizuhopecten yessoensis]XP_021372811.1 neuronal acetylcholine receptor subunit beta-3-like [Mizuhopecten yessoensis]OWF41132.1 Neuronal acetylcholine receptor subunit beta-3 [Mizuhopecten yessoensis]